MLEDMDAKLPLTEYTKEDEIKFMASNKEEETNNMVFAKEDDVFCI